MRPVPIPSELVWEGGTRRVVSGPDGDLTGPIEPLEVITDILFGAPRYCIRLMLEPGDLERLGQDPHFWLVWWGQYLHPFSFAFPPDAISEQQGDAR